MRTLYSEYMLSIVILLLLLGVVPFPHVSASSCPGANPNDQLPDDAALQLCLDAGGTISLDPGSPGYIIDIGLNVTVNYTVITSSAAPQKATLIAGQNLGFPIVQTSGIIFNIILEYLIVDGNKYNRATQNHVYCVTGPYNLNYRTTNIMLPGYVINGVWSTWDPSVFIDSVIIHDLDSINSPCGAGIGIQGRNYEIYATNISHNGWDTFYNPQNLSFPYADGINAAVCMNGYIHDNLIVDNTNMQVAAGPGPYSRIEKNTILQSAVVTQCGINCWPTNVWLTTPIWWHPAPWNLAHSSITSNIVETTNTVTGGAYIGIALGALPWANISLTNTGFVWNNTVCGSDVNLMVDGVTVGTIWNNVMYSPSGSGGKTSSICPTPQDYTVAKSSYLFLQPGFSVLTFDLGTPCSPTGENIVSTYDNSKFINWKINDVNLPSSLSGSAGTVWPVKVTYMNTGTSVWQDIAGENGYGVKLGDALHLAAPFWGVYRAELDNEIVYPGGEVTYFFHITLPSTPGTYEFQWQLVQELVDWFGELTPSIPITVV